MATDWLTYANQGATRSQPLSPQLINALSFLPELGVSMEVFSGGQDATGPNRVGSHRHDLGNAGDVFFSKDGRRLDWANPADIPTYQEIVRRARSGGVTGIGAGEGYMQPGSVHIGFGAPSVWGAGGSSANAPEWLREAYGSGGGGDGTVAQASSSPSLGVDMAGALDPRSAVMAQMQNSPWQSFTDTAEKRGGLVGEGSAGGGLTAPPAASPDIPVLETASANLTPNALGPEQPGSISNKLAAPLANLFKLKPIGNAAAAPGQALPMRRSI